MNLLRRIAHLPPALARALVAGGGCGLAAVVLAALAAVVGGKAWALTLLAVTGAAGGAALGYWLYRSGRVIEQKLEKSALTARRFQNIAKYFESILQDSPDIIFSIDQEGFVLKFNNGSQMTFGYSQEEIVGKPLATLFVNEQDVNDIMTKVLLEGTTSNREVPMKTRDGRLIVLNMSISEMKGPRNEIIGFVATAKDITEKKRLEKELLEKNQLLNRLATTDSLTELYNSRSFFEQLKRELSRFERNPTRPLSILLIDIDRFKELNDTEGHQRGDQVLRSLGEIIRVCIRKNVDSGYRYGGDEFVVILPDTDREKAAVVAERIKRQFAAMAYGNTSLSIGITEARQGEDGKQFLSRADEAMYMSKRGGRNRISML